LEQGCSPVSVTVFGACHLHICFGLIERGNPFRLGAKKMSRTRSTPVTEALATLMGRKSMAFSSSAKQIGRFPSLSSLTLRLGE
jgi:hypothetical protein